MSDQNEILTKEAIKKLVVDAREVTTLFAIWTNTLESLKSSTDAFAAVPYYLKWVDVAITAVDNINETASQDVYKQLANDLISIIVVPLRGMLEAMATHAKQKNLVIPPPLTAMPTDVFTYKKWAVEYISIIMKWMKGLDVK